MPTVDALNETETPHFTSAPARGFRIAKVRFREVTAPDDFKSVVDY